LGRRNAVRAIGGDHGGVRLGDVLFGLRSDLGPFAVEHELAARDLEEVAVHGVVRHVSLVEDDAVAAPRERPAEAAPQGGVAVAPGGADRQAEDDDSHAGTSFIDRTFMPQSPVTKALMDAGLT